MPIKGWKRILVVILCLGAGFFVWTRVKQGKNPQEILKEVHPAYGAIQKFVSATGTVQPQNRLEMKSPISGRVDKILVTEGQKVKMGDLLVLMSSTDRAALLDAAKPQGEKVVSYWEDVYKPTPIIAPIDGEVIVKSVQPGQTVTPADDVVVLSDRLIVGAQVDETDIGKVKEGQKTVVSLDAYPDIEVQAGVGHIYYESKTVNNVTIYQVDILPETVPAVFRSGMSANVRIIQDSKDHILLVPLEAVKRLPARQAGGKEGDFVFVSQGRNKKPLKREVKLGISDDTNVEILSGIDENDTLVIKTQKRAPAVKTPQSKTNPFMPAGRGGR
jgi:macrolide-specific efflux system membrane fusion protein